MAVDVLVTGAAGALGQQIVSQLRAANYETAACGRVPGDAIDANWDISKQDAPEPDCAPETVIHAAARIGSYSQALETADPLFEVNVTGALRVARWCAARGVKRLVLISGAIVYGEWTDSPKSETDPVKPWLAGPYAVSKWCSESVASLFTHAGGELTILRLSSLYGKYYDNGLVQRLLRQGRETGQIHLEPPFDDAFDLLHLSDAASTVLKASEIRHGGLWNVGSGRLVTIRELAETCASQVNAKVDLSSAVPGRERRIINWVDDTLARDQLDHAGTVSLESGISEIDKSLKNGQ